MQKLQDSVFNIIKTTNLSPAVFSFLQPTDDFTDKTPLGGILSDTKHGWLALGPKFCVIDLRSGLKIAARVFGNGLSCCTSVTSVVELPTPLTSNSHQLVISLECDNVTGMICVFHINGSQLLHCIQTDVVVSELAVCDDIPSSPFMCFDGLIMAGTKRGEVLVFDLNRTCLIDALKNISQGHEDEVLNEANAANLVFLPLKALHKIEGQRDLAIDNNDHLAVLLNEDSFIDGQYVFRNPDGSIRMKAKRDHIKVTVVQYIPQLASLAVGYNFGAFQIWNLLDLKLEFTSQVNVECLPVTHFGFQEPCDDPRAFCYLWVVFSVIDRFEEEEFPLAVMYSLTYQGKRMMSEDTCLYQEFSTATIRFQVELGAPEGSGACVGGRCISCRTYSVNSALADDGDDSLYTNICQLAWECWGERAGAGAYHSALLFDLDQWYKEQMPATSQLESNAFMAVSWVAELSRGECLTLDVRLDPASAAPYSHATRLEEHFYPNSLQYNCICLNTSEALVLHTAGVQRQLVGALAAAGPACLLAPARLRAACAAAGLAPQHRHACPPDDDPEEQRRCLLTVALEARLPNFLKRCAHDWATGTHSGVGCTLTFLVDWSWKRAIELKENAKELTAPLFTSSTVPDRNVIRCLEHCVQQLTQLTGLLDAILTKCCNLVVPDALSEMEEKFKGIGTVSLYFQVVQWFLRVGLLPERQDACAALPYPAHQLYTIYKKRRLKLQRLEDKSPSDDENESCSLLYIDQLIEHEFGGDRTHQMWMRGGSENGGLYPPPSLYALLRLYLLPDIAEEHKHSLVLYLLVDYSMVYDEIRYEEVIRRLMQFPTMFGLSNTAIKATQAFWHLDHRDFDFALDQLQCLTGNTLSEWQHNVVLSSLLAQKKTQAALQYLHVRKPAPVQNLRDKDTDYNRMSDHDKLEDWRPCCNLYLARGLVYEALDVVRMCVQNAGAVEDKLQVLNFFFKGCRNTGQLAKILNVTLLPSEEEAFIQYLQGCNEPQTSDILIMYYLQQARYLEAEQYNNKIKSKGRAKDLCTSAESLLDVMDREGARDMLVEVVCSAVPSIANSVARCAQVEFEPHIIAPKPMSVFVQARSPKNTFTYKSSFIQDTIENASETWVNKPQMRRGIKRALNVEDTPFICTPKLFRTKSLFQDQQGNSTPPKRAKLDLSGTPKTSKMQQTPRVSDKLSKQMATLLDMPEIQSPGYKPYNTRSGAGTPQSILKTRRLEGGESPADSRYLPDSDDELLETCSNHTHYSDSKHLRFTIPTASEGSSTPSPAHPVAAPAHLYRSGGERDSDNGDTPEMEPPSVSPPKKLAVEEIKAKKLYKDTVKARRSLSISANSSLSDNPNSSIESIADIPMTLINPKYTGQRRRQTPTEMEDADRTGESEREEAMDSSMEYTLLAPKVPQGRKSIRNVMDTTSFVNRSRSHTPERVDSPVATPLRVSRVTRSRSRTPEVSPRLSPLAPIPELPKQESNSEPHPTATLLSVPRLMRSRSRTPERVDTVAAESRLQPITESPGNTDAPARPSARRALRQRSKTPPRLEEVSEETKMEVIPESPLTSNTESPLSSPTRRSLRSRSRTPEVEEHQPITSPRILRSRSKTPEKLMSPKKDATKSRKSLSRMVLEANAFAKTKQNVEKTDNPETVIESTEAADDKTGSAIECTPLKSSKEPHKLMDVTFSPIVNKSILQSSSESVFSGTTEKPKIDDESVSRLEPLPAFTTISESYVEKSVLHSYQSSIAETSSIRMEEENIETTNITVSKTDYKSLPAFNTINETAFGKSVLKSFQSSIAESSMDYSKFEQVKEIPKTFADLKSLNESELAKSVLRSEESSVAITSDESFAKGHREETGVMTQNMSSLITDDSDVEMKDWGSRLYSQETAKSIQKEKQKIVEIEREINEMEDDMSDDCQVEHDTDSEDDDGEEEESEDDSQEEEEGTESDTEEEIISIADSDESCSSVKDKMHGHEKIQSEERNINAIQSVEVETENENEGISEEIEVSTDPLNQAQVSMLTDDNSVEELPVNLNYSDETKPVQEEDSKNNEMKNIEMGPALEDVQIEVVVETIEPATEDIKDSSEEPKNTDDVDYAISKQQPEYSSISHESEKNKNLENKNQTSEQKTVEEILEQQPEVDIRKKFEVKVDKNIDEKETVEQKVKETTPEKVIEKPVENVEEVNEKAVEKEVKEKSVETSTVEKSVENQDVKKKAPETEVKEKPEKNELKEQPIEKEHKKKPIQIEETMKEYSETPQPKPSRRKRISSASSVKSFEDIEDTDQVTEEPKTPGILKRAQSTASNKSVTEDSTPEVKTPRRKSKTPPREVRTILTRRVSRELGLEDVEMNLDQIVTPRRRTTRSSSKNLDDSLILDKSKGRESVEPDVKPTSARKGKKKTDLSVIPEVTAEESELKDSDSVKGGSRTTRQQRSVLPAVPERDPSEDSLEGDDVRAPAFDVQPIDRITLLNKTDFDGPPDEDEARRNDSPVSFLSESRPRNRLARAASESKTTPRASRVTRKVSVDVVSELGESPASSPRLAGRRASFSRACEALLTPKGRRTSVDSKKGETDSQGASPAEAQATPARRSRRTSSARKQAE